jgi:glucose-6-phosphate 1-dehydrogenase
MERAVYRVDHVLGMPTTQNLLALRTTNPVLESFWNSTYIERIDVLWEETLALEGRAGYYDHAGALKDVMQNHMMQLLAIVAMEPPTDGTVTQLRRNKLLALRSARLPCGARALRSRSEPPSSGVACGSASTNRTTSRCVSSGRQPRVPSAR